MDYKDHPPPDSLVSRRELELRLTALRELLDSREHAFSKALELQAAEYSRRMAELNHAHQQAQDNWARSLPRETFSNFVDQWDKWRSDVNASINAAQGGLSLLRFIGLAGMLAFLMELLRLTGVTK
jgi:hypothetical protein